MALPNLDAGGPRRQTATVDGERARAYAAATNDLNPVYLDGRYAPPVFGVVPTWDAWFGGLEQVVPAERASLVLHAEHDMVFHQPLVPGMALDSVADLYCVRVARSGTWITVRSSTVDGRGALVFEQFGTIFVRGMAGGTDSGPDRPEHPFPDGTRARPVAKAVRHVDADQTARYAEASGDRNPIHLSDEVARSANLPGIILHGLCTMAMCGSVVVDEIAGGDPGRLARLAVRFSRPVFPDSDLAVTVFEGGPGTFAFEAESGGKLVVRNGWAEVRG